MHQLLPLFDLKSAKGLLLQRNVHIDIIQTMARQCVLTVHEAVLLQYSKIVFENTVHVYNPLVSIILKPPCFFVRCP